MTNQIEKVGSEKKIFIHECGTGNWEMNKFVYPFTHNYKKPLLMYPIFEYKGVFTYKKIKKDQLIYFKAIRKAIDLIIKGIEKSL